MARRCGILGLAFVAIVGTPSAAAYSARTAPEEWPTTDAFPPTASTTAARSSASRAGR